MPPLKKSAYEEFLEFWRRQRGGKTTPVPPPTTPPAISAEDYLRFGDEGVVPTGPTISPPSVSAAATPSAFQNTLGDVGQGVSALTTLAALSNQLSPKQQIIPSRERAVPGNFYRPVQAQFVQPRSGSGNTDLLTLLAQLMQRRNG